MLNNEISHKYDDILSMPHPNSKNHPRMARRDRAAQFSPFAALSGYDAVLQEAGRLTTLQKELDEGVEIQQKELANARKELDFYADKSQNE